jgi:hypothetical protein
LIWDFWGIDAAATKFRHPALLAPGCRVRTPGPGLQFFGSKAELPASSEAKQNYLRIAAHWRTLAEHDDHIERTEAFLGALPD